MVSMFINIFTEMNVATAAECFTLSQRESFVKFV